MHGFSVQTYGEACRGVCLWFKGVNQKSGLITFLDLCHSACLCKIYTSKCCPELQTLYYLTFLFFFQASDILSRKKLVQISSYRRARFIALSGLKIRHKYSYEHSRAIQCKYTSYSAVSSKSGKGRQRNMHVQYRYSSFFTRACTWNIAKCMASQYKHMVNTLGGVSLI